MIGRPDNQQMVDKQARASAALLSQLRSVAGWLDYLSAADFDRPGVLPGWDVRTMVGHLVLVVTGFDLVLGRPTVERPVPAWELVRRYRRDVAQIETRTHAVTGNETGAELVSRLRAGLTALTVTLEGPLPVAIDSP